MPAATHDPLAALQSRLAGRFSIERELGRGGMGVVYLAHDVALDRRVAIKLLPAEFAVQGALRDRFLREARLVARLSHPNIVPIYAVEEHDDAVFFVMGYIEGETLGQRIARVGALQPPDVTGMLQQVAWALAYAHGRNVIHRDIKPDNILLEQGSGRAYVMDFGIARATDSMPANATAAPALTEVGHVVGTAAFMSPEQATGDAVDGRADLYSLGVVGFVALTGRLPFIAASSQALLAKHLTEAAPPVASLRPGVSAELGRTIDKLLAKNPDDRFATGEAVADALGPISAAQAEIPAALRNYLRSAEQNAVQAAVTFSLVVGLGVIRPGLLVPLAVFATFTILARVVDQVVSARRVYSMGYRWPDVAQAFEADRRVRDEESRQLAGAQDPLRRKRAIRRSSIIAAAGVAVFCAMVVATDHMGMKGIRGPNAIPWWLIYPAIAALFTGVIAFVAAVSIAVATRKVAPKPRTGGGFWVGPVGKWFFSRAVSGVTALPPREAAGALYQLLDEVEAVVPKSDRAAVRAARKRMDEHAEQVRRLRTRERELERAQAETGEAHATERLKAARAEVKIGLEQSTAAMDALRLKLILVRTGVAGVNELA